MDLTSILLRWLHIIPAILMVGGTFFMWLAHDPLATAEGNELSESQQRIRSIWAKVVMACTLGLLASGLINFVLIVKKYELEPMPYHALFGIKFLLAMGVFLIAALHSGRTSAAARVRANGKKWLGLCVLMAIVLVCLAGVMRISRDSAPLKTTAESTAQTLN